MNEEYATSLIENTRAQVSVLDCEFVDNKLESTGVSGLFISSQAPTGESITALSGIVDDGSNLISSDLQACENVALFLLPENFMTERIMVTSPDNFLKCSPFDVAESLPEDDDRNSEFFFLRDGLQLLFSLIVRGLKAARNFTSTVWA